MESNNAYIEYKSKVISLLREKIKKETGGANRLVEDYIPKNTNFSFLLCVVYL